MCSGQLKRIGRSLTCCLGLLTPTLLQPAFAQTSPPAQGAATPSPEPSAKSVAATPDPGADDFKVSLGMALRDVRHRAGTFIALILEDTNNNWEFPSSPTSALDVEELFAMERQKWAGPKIWLNFRNQRQFPEEGLTGFTVQIEFAKAKNISKLAPVDPVAINPRKCPAKDLIKSLNIFSESEEIQRRYTRFPFEYNLEQDRPYVGTTRETITIKSAEELKRLFSEPLFPDWNTRIRSKINTYVSRYSPSLETALGLDDLARKEKLLKSKGLNKDAFIAIVMSDLKHLHWESLPKSVRVEKSFNFAYRQGCWRLLSGGEKKLR